MADHFDPYYTWLGIPPDEQPADHYRLLGVKRFEANEEVIANAGDQRMAYLRTFQVGKRAKESQQLLNEISAAQGCLLNAKKRQPYDAELRRKLAAKQPAIAKPALLPQAVPLSPVIVARGPTPQPALPVAARPAGLPQATPLGALGSLEVAAKPLRPVEKPTSGLPLPLPILIAGGSAAAVLFVLVAFTTWMVTRPAPAPTIANVPPGTTPAPAGPEVPKPRPTSPPSGPPSAPPPAPPPAPAERPPAAAPSEPALTETQTPTPGPPATLPASAAAARKTVAASGGVLLLEVSGAKWRGGRLSLGTGGQELFWNDPAAQEVFHQDVAGRTKGGTFRGTAGYVLSPDGSRLAVITDDRVGVRPTEDLRQVLWSGTTKGRIKSAAFTEDNRQLATAIEGFLKVVEIESRTIRQDVASRLADVEWVAIRGNLLCCWSASGSGEFIVLDNPAQKVRLFNRLQWPPAGLTPWGLMTYHRVNAGHVSFYFVRPEDGQRSMEFHADDFADPSQLLALSPAGDVAIVASQRGLLTVAELPQCKVLTRLEWAGGDFQVAAVSGRKGALAVNGPLDKLLVFDIKRLAEQPKWRLESDQALAVAAEKPGPSAVTSATGSSPPVAAPGQTPTAREAMNVLRAARVSLSGSSDNVFSIRTANSSFGPEHAPLLAAFPQLSSLYFIGHENIGAVLAALPAMPAVKTLTLDRSKLSDSDLVHLAKFPQLDRLSLVSTGVGPGLEHLGKAPNLRNLTLPANLSREAIPFISRAKQLQTCSPWPRGLTDDDLAQIAALENLTGLSLSQAKITGAGIDHLQRMPKLERVYISQTAPRDVVQAVSKLNLKYMSFPMGTPADDIALYARMPRLTSVTLPGDWTREHLRALAMFPVLNDLHLSNAKIADRDLALLADIKSLREVTAPITLTDSGAAALAQAAHLERLEVTACRGLTDRGVADLAKIPALKQLLLGPGVGDGAIAELVKLPALESLSFDRSSLTALGLGKLEQARSLQSLTLQNIAIDSAGLETLKKLSQLKSLSLFGHRLSAAQIQSLRQALRGCSISNSTE